MLGLVGLAVGGVCSVVAAVRAARRRQWKWWLLGSTVGVFLVWRSWAGNLLMLVVVFLVFAFPVIAIATAAYRPEEDAAAAGERAEFERSDERGCGTLLAVLALMLVPAAAGIYALRCVKSGGYMGSHNACRQTIDIWPVLLIAAAISVVLLGVAMWIRITESRRQIVGDGGRPADRKNRPPAEPG
jgi:hypothetical protein